jgi:Zn-dependent protease/CBS domain-containing protein
MRSFRIARVVGIPIEVTVSFLVVLPIVAWLIATQVGQLIVIFNRLFAANLTAAVLTGGVTPYILGTVAAIGLFVGVVLHELGHSVVSMHYGYDIDAITLWFLGGIAQLTELPDDWKQELAVAIAGPIVSVILGAICYGVFLALPASFEAGRFVVAYLAVLNVVLAVFNLLPGFPLDGGRVLRALLARTRSYATATQLAASVGKTIAVVLGLYGLLTLQIFLIFIAFFIYISASSEAQQMIQKAAFEGVRVREVMTPAEQVSSAMPDMSVADLLARMFSERHTGYPVINEGELVGMVTLTDAREVRDAEQEAYRVEEIMTTDLRTIPLDAEAITALSVMQTDDIGRLPVIDVQGEFAGLLTRTDLMNALSVIRSGGAIGTADEELAPDTATSQAEDSP